MSYKQKDIIKIGRHATKAVLAKEAKDQKRILHEWKMFKRITPELMLDLIKAAGYTIIIQDDGE